MSEQQQDFLKKLRITLISAAITFAAMIITTSTSFYFNTQNTVKVNSKDIQELRKEKARKDVYEAIVKNIDRRLTNIEDKL